MREDPNVDDRSLWELLIGRYNDNPESQEFAGLECTYEALTTDAGGIALNIIPEALTNNVGIAFPDEATRNEAQYCCIAARELTDRISEIYGLYMTEEIRRAGANLAYYFPLDAGIRATQINIVRAKEVLISGRPVLEAGINSETMVYFARSSTGLMTRLPICNQSQKVALEGMVDYMNMMTHFLG